MISNFSAHMCKMRNRDIMDTMTLPGISIQSEHVSANKETRVDLIAQVDLVWTKKSTRENKAMG